AACGGSSGSGQPAGSIMVTMTEYKFQPKDLNAPHGKVVFWLVNSGSTQHDMAIEDSSGTTIATSELVSVGDSKEFDVNDVKAGGYKIYCTQPGHRASGMEGTLTVT
ncbi:MAG TPA: plastocyanin/azurin family copper-binding protein, partial [Candidatus Dormibacteraeota bacterium]|nr:plastocyanin/azurin family copper-binding protein [Candidatus Dormibacteraeota bacterium]